MPPRLAGYLDRISSPMHGPEQTGPRTTKPRMERRACENRHEVIRDQISDELAGTNKSHQISRS
jgi:hypothetical protein